jgi:glycosyltransferase involved in cell wall biosynthesis
MRIIALVQKFRQGYGGGPESIRLLARVLKSYGASVAVRSSHGSYEDVGRLETLPKAESDAVSQPIWKIVRNSDVVLIIGPWIRSALPVVLIARLLGKTVVYMPKGGLAKIEFRRKPLVKFLYFYCYELLSIALSNKIVFSSVTESRETSIIGPFLRRRVAIIPELFSFAESRRAPTLPAEGFVVGFLAELSPRKGLAECVQGFLKWAEEYPEINAKLIIAGGVRDGCADYVSAVEAQIVRSAHSSKVSLVGPLRHEDREVFYKRLHVFCMPSIFESFGLTLLEAMWCGVPVICGPNVGALDQLSDHANCHVMTDVTPIEISRALEAAYERHLRTNVAGTDRQSGAAKFVSENDAIARDMLGVLSRPAAK